MMKNEMKIVNNEKEYFELILNIGKVRSILVSEIKENINEKRTKNKIVKEALNIVIEKVFDKNLIDKEQIKEFKKNTYKKIEKTYGSSTNRFISINNDYEIISINSILEEEKEGIEVYIEKGSKETRILKGEKYKKIYDMDLYICKEKGLDYDIYYIVDKNNKLILFNGTKRIQVINRFNLFIEENTEIQVKEKIEKTLIDAGIKEVETQKVEKYPLFKVWDKHFTSYEEALNYCNKCDFEPKLMIEDLNNKDDIDKKIDKIKNRINLLEEKIIDTKNNIEYEKLDKILLVKESEFKELREQKRIINKIRYNNQLKEVIKAYKGYKYKVIEKCRIYYSDSIKDINKPYIIEVFSIVNNREVNIKVSYDKTFLVMQYDEKGNLLKKELYDNSDTKLIKFEINRYDKKNNCILTYINSENKKECSINNYDNNGKFILFDMINNECSLSGKKRLLNRMKKEFYNDIEAYNILNAI